MPLITSEPTSTAQVWRDAPPDKRWMCATSTHAQSLPGRGSAGSLYQQYRATVG